MANLGGLQGIVDHAMVGHTANAAIGVSGALRRGRRSKPGGERVSEPQLGRVSHPGHVAVGPNQHGAGSSDRPDRRKLPRSIVRGLAVKETGANDIAVDTVQAGPGDTVLVMDEQTGRARSSGSIPARFGPSSWASWTR
jgi:hypothetical protein